MTCPKRAELAVYAGMEAPRRRIPKVQRQTRACSECKRTVSEFQLIPVYRGGQRLPDADRRPGGDQEQNP